MKAKKVRKLLKRERRQFLKELAAGTSTLLSQPDRVKYSPDEERDDSGRWSGGGGGSPAEHTYVHDPKDGTCAVCGEPRSGGFGMHTPGVVQVPISRDEGGIPTQPYEERYGRTDAQYRRNLDQAALDAGMNR